MSPFPLSKKKAIAGVPARTVEYQFFQGTDAQIITDSSGNGNTANLGSVNTSDTNEPVYTAQGLYFANKLVRGVRTPYQSSENRTLLLMCAATARANQQLFTIGGSPFGLRLVNTGVLRFIYYVSGSTTQVLIDTPMNGKLYDPNTFHIFSLRKNMTTGIIRLGIDKTFTEFAETAALNNVTTGNTQFGRNSDNGFAFYGTIAHWCFFNTALSDSDFDKAYDYMLATQARLRGLGVPGTVETLLTA